MKYIVSLFILILAAFQLSFSQVPSGYYDSAEGLTGESLRTALRNIIDNHNQQSYSSLWTHFQSTDKKSNGKVWDMYSLRADGTSSYEYTFVTDQCGNYSGEGSCYNREHSFPKSWFNDDYPAYSDLFHLYPTDGYTNGKRNNFPYGEVSNASWTSTNGSKRGSCSYPGYSGTVFEPIDEFKGDFARTYFYMLTRYQTDISSWSSAMLSGNNFSSWAENLLIEWHQEDPVSQKEIDRNNAVYEIQGNRNPYIDNPEWAIAVWKPEQLGVVELGNKIQVWYNSGKLNWTGQQNVESIEIYNVLGQNVKTLSRLRSSSNKNVNLLPGVYLAKIKAKKSYVIKFVVKK